jgi:glycerophosphoryl diester phosphodiesterase
MPPTRAAARLVIVAAILALSACAQPQPRLQEVSTPMCQTLNIAHRGARSLAPENTLAAARVALEIGADLWELDVAMTADGELFVVHDDTLERTSNVKAVFPNRAPWSNYLFTLEEVRRLDFGTWFLEKDPFKQIAAGNVSVAEQESFRGEKAPTLREALVFTRDHDWRVNVEIKDLVGTPGDATVVEKVVALVRELDMTDRVLISSFNHAYVERAKKAEPKIATAALVEEADPDPAALLRRLHAQAYNPKLGKIRPEAIGALRDQGVDVYIWTVNDEKAMRELIAARASGIFTDFPQRLKPLAEACE